MDKRVRIGDSDYVLEHYINDILFYPEINSIISKLDSISLEHARSILIPYIENSLRNSKGLCIGKEDRDEYYFCLIKDNVHVLTSKSYIGFHDDSDYVMSEEEISSIVSEFDEWFTDPE